MKTSILDILNHRAAHALYTQVNIESWLGVSKHIYIKRFDLIDPYVSGNKWYKLKYNIQHALDLKCKGIISYGGAYSNHLLALAYLCHQLDIPCYGIVRGERHAHNSKPIETLQHLGMHVYFINRNAYRLKEISEEIQSILNYLGPEVLCIPEGGSNQHALLGVAEMISTEDLNRYDRILMCCGTGCTLAGILARHRSNSEKFIGISTLKGNFMRQEIQHLLDSVDVKNSENIPFTLWEDLHQGGYGKSNPILDDFCKDFYTKTNVAIEPTYSGKLFYGLVQKLKQDPILLSKRLLVLHTGGVHPE